MREEKKGEKYKRMKMRSAVIFLTWRAAALPEGTSGNCCSCWSACGPAALSYQTSARREGSSHSTQDMTSALTRRKWLLSGTIKIRGRLSPENQNQSVSLSSSVTQTTQNRRTDGGRKRRDKDWQQLEEEEKWRREGRRDRTGTLDDKTPGGQTQDGGQLEERMRENKTRQREGNEPTRWQLTCMPITAYMKNSITISRAT